MNRSSEGYGTQRTALRLGYFCADFDSPYKSYFPRQVRGLDELDVTVFGWEVDQEAKDGIRRVQIAGDWDGPSLRGRFERKLRRLGIPIGMPGAREIAGVLECLRGHDFDLALLHTGFVAMRVAPALKKIGLPYVIQCHGGDVREAMAVSGWGRMFSRICREAELVLVVGGYMVDQLASIGVPRSKMVVEPMGAPVSERAPVIPPSGLPPFVFVGRLVPCKSVETIVRAVASTPEDSGVRVRLIGEGPLRGDLESLVNSEGVGDRVEFVGTLSPHEVAESLDQSAGLVIATVDEPGGPEAASVAVVEAMAAARPVLATRCGGLVDQVAHGKTGLLFDQRDHLELGRHMQDVLGSYERRESLGEAGRARALDLYDAAARSREVQRLLELVVAS